MSSRADGIRFLFEVRSWHTNDEGGASVGNISYRLDLVLCFEPLKEKFVGDKEADQLLTREYRKPIVVPDKV